MRRDRPWSAKTTGDPRKPWNAKPAGGSHKPWESKLVGARASPGQRRGEGKPWSPKPPGERNRGVPNRQVRESRWSSKPPGDRKAVELRATGRENRGSAKPPVRTSEFQTIGRQKAGAQSTGENRGVQSPQARGNPELEAIGRAETSGVRNHLAQQSRAPRPSSGGKPWVAQPAGTPRKPWGANRPGQRKPVA